VPIVEPVVPIVETPVPVEPAAPPTPRRSFGEWVAVFMEERNILWGELIGGSLIVGCSIALVISLWQTLEQIPFFPFLIFAAITSALFGAGFYTLHHWKLESTSRGLLLIATLLVPLDFLVLAGLTRVDGAGLWDYVIALGALTAFGWFLYRSSHILIETPLDTRAPSALLIAGAMVFCAAAQLLAPAWLANEELRTAGDYTLSLLPVLAQAGALGWILARMSGVEPWSIGRVAALLIALGSVTFACCVTLSYPLYAAGDDLGRALLHLSPALTLLGAPILVTGTLIYKKLAPAEEGGEAHGLWRTLGTGLALTGIFVMFGGFTASVGDPGLRWLCGAINIGTLLAVAFALRVPALHVPAQIYVMTLLVYGWHADLDALMREPTVPLRLAAVLIVQALAAEVLIRLHRPLDARYYAVGGSVSTVLACVLVVPYALTHAWAAAIVLGLASLTWFASNLRWRRIEITYACSLVLAPAIFFAFREFTDIPFREQLLWSLLTHATVCLVVAMLMRLSARDWLHDCFRLPLMDASLLASFLVAALVVVEQVPANLSWADSCIACAWLAALWLTVAALESRPLLFAAFQVALSAAWFFGAGGWLTAQDWDWREPFSLHVYGLGLASFSLAWELLRMRTRDAGRIATLLKPDFVPVDRLLTGALIVGQYALLLCTMSWNIGRELSTTPHAWRILPVAWHDGAYTLAAWLLPIVLAAVLVVWLREINPAIPLLGLTLLALSLPLLLAGTWFDATLASASAVRWGLAACYGLVSLALWYRHRLGEERAASVPAVAIRALLALGAAAPILFLTAQVAARKLGGIAMAGPLDDSVFMAMGGPVSLLLPLALLSAALAGHGVRERLAYYLLAAGLLANAGGVGGYFLALQRLDRLGESWVVSYALLVAAAVAWIWTSAWTAIASRLEQDDDRPLLDSLLLRVNNLLGAMLFAAVLVPALTWIAFSGAEPGRFLAEAAGSAWGWLVFGLMALGAGFFHWERRASLPLWLLGMLSFTAVGVLACSVEVFSPADGFVALMFGAASFACLWMWLNLFLNPAEPPALVTFSSDLWESVAFTLAGAVLAVGLGAASMVSQPIWAAQSIALAALACGLLAFQRKTEVWTTLATPLLMLAATILVLHVGKDDDHVLMRTLHINLAVLGGASLAWLGLHRFLAPAGVELERRPLLAAQIALGLLVNGLLVIPALFELILVPDRAGDWLQLQTEWSGWVALAPSAIAAIWYVAAVRPRAVVHAVALNGLLGGVMLAGSIGSAFDPQVAWLAHHVLTLSWTLLGLALLLVSWLSCARDPADIMQRCFPERTTRFWVALCGGSVVLLALRASWVEPAMPYWSVGNTFAVSVLLGALAIWARVPLYQYGSGLLFNVIGWLLFAAWSAHRPELTNDEWLATLVLAQILSFGAAAIVWSLLERRLVRLGIDLSHGAPIPFTQAAILAGIHLLAVGVALANGLHLNGEELHIGCMLAWISLGILVAASSLEIWRQPEHRFTRFELYTSGLMALGLLLHGMALSNADWFWAATLLLSAYVLLIVGLLRLIHAVPRLQDALGAESGARWLWHAQLVSIGLVLVLSVWITLTYTTWQDRLGGAVASAVVTVAAFLLVQTWQHVFPADDTAFGLRHRLTPYWLVLALGVVIALETCWALVDPATTAVWLQRNGIAFTIVVAASLLYRFAIPRLFAHGGWVDAGRSLAAVLGVVSLLMLGLLLGQELVLYDPADGVKRTPLLVELAAVTSLALVGLVACSLYSALGTEADPYGLEGHRRSFYVYLAEVLVAVLIAHLRLNLPALLPPVLGQYWYLAVLVIAFAWLALSELFTRKAMPVLATPLKRTAIVLAFVPVLFFQLVKVAGWLMPLGDHIKGLQPFLAYLDRAQQAQNVFLWEALCWLLLGIFFGWLAQLKRSGNLGIAAALFVNFGLWVLLGHQDATTFLQRPQLWLIPLGLIVLIAEYLNREQLGFWPSLSVRYAGLSCIYLSSTFEMFTELVSRNAIFPIALALLAVAGMLLGILFRVRAFLLSGFLALLTVIFAQIWNAAVMQGITWIWWASGIVLGVVILAMFALFEKHRNDVLRVIDSMKRWT
jgi:hypothetical protein